MAKNLAIAFLVITVLATACQSATPTPGPSETPAGAVETQAATTNTPGNSGISDTLISFLAGAFVALVGVISKYLFDYRLERRKLELEERQGIATVLGSSQASFVRATRELFRWISNFFDHPDSSRQSLTPGSTPEGDAYSLRDFARRLFDFIAWGRIAQDAINSLPTDVVKERPDLQQTFVFVDLALDILAYGNLLSGITAQDAEIEQSRLFMGQIDLIAEAGKRLWKDDERNISRAAFDDLYSVSDSPLTALRDFLIRFHTDQTATTDFRMARLAALRAVLAGFLLSYSWIMDIPEQRELVNQLQAHLRLASGTSNIRPPFTDAVPQNLGQLMIRYRCKLFRLP
ncbi:MAG TPA: hypothetical protein VK206_11850 [Anaerolineales bacterium]|nr:hypothetical protein [Anaerolineales bacterium]HLO31293.1 hypothetical protein [Anaerolineales bacterium]